MTDDLAQSLDDFVLISDVSSSGSPRSPIHPPPNIAMLGDIQSNYRNNPHPHPHTPAGLYPLFTTYSHHPPLHQGGPSSHAGPPPHEPPHGHPPHGPPDHGSPHHGPPPHGPPDHGSPHHGPPRHGGPPSHGPPRAPRHGGPPPHGPPPPPHYSGGEHHPPSFHRGHHPRYHRGHGDCDHSSNPSIAFTTNSSAPHSDVTLFLHKIISGSHPKAGIMAIPSWEVDLLGFAKYPENGVKVTPNFTELPGSPFVEYGYKTPGRRGDNLGSLEVDTISWGRFDYEYNNESFILYLTSSWRIQFLVHEPKKASDLGTAENSKELIKDLILRACHWEQELHNEVWVYDQGYWQKDAALWNGLQKANWDDVILPPGLKSAVRGDVESFFKNKSTYDDIGIAWKRGIIMYGPPGNGKTVSLKALMKDVYYSLKISPIPTLYVRSLQGSGGALLEIFDKARSVAPCMLVFEDLDSMIYQSNRSYFLNQMDGLDDNNGILVVGTTNHLDALDPGIVARPSRFDRKYEFGLPGAGEGGRPTYVEYWRKKLDNRPGIQFPESLVAKIVDMTEGFSFAYMKEAFVSTLLLIAARQGNGDEKDRKGLFEKVILEQLKILRKQIGNE